jgi:hypothetical protein
MIETKKREDRTVSFNIDKDNYATVEYTNGEPMDIFIKVDGGTMIFEFDRLEVLESLMEQIKEELNEYNKM